MALNKNKKKTEHKLECKKEYNSLAVSESNESMRFKAEIIPKNFPTQKIPFSFPRKWRGIFQELRKLQSAEKQRSYRKTEELQRGRKA